MFEDCNFLNFAMVEAIETVRMVEAIETVRMVEAIETVRMVEITTENIISTALFKTRLQS
jgi:hypothetical protein